jgi:hypothetical protein
MDSLTASMHPLDLSWDLTNFTYPPYLKNFDFTNRTFYSLEELERKMKRMAEMERLEAYLQFFSEFTQEVKEGDEAVEMGQDYDGKYVHLRP